MNGAFQLGTVTITGGFWKQRLHTICAATVPHMWRALNDCLEGAPKSGAIHNLRLAAGLETGTFFGLVSQDSDLFKWMEAAAYALHNEPSADTRRALEAAITLLEQAQREDGYLNAYYQLYHAAEPWAYLKESCQLYCAGHMIEAGVGCYEAMGETRLLSMATRLADRIDADFGPEEGKLHGYDGHAEIELALMRLYGATGEKRYLRLASYFIEQRGQKPFYFDLEKQQNAIRQNLVYALEEEDYHHSQSHAPIRQQHEAKGHAVKAMYFYSGACDVAEATHDDSLYQALDGLWDSVMTQMYVTGAIGSSEHGERFTVAYDLPNALDYGETCASIGLFLFAFRMLQHLPSAVYGDVMERALYNNILAGIGLDGRTFFYTNPLAFQPEVNRVRHDREHILPRRQPWFDCPCCPPNIARLIGSLDRYLYTHREGTLYVHHYMASDASFPGGMRLVQETDYPFDGKVILHIAAVGTQPPRRIALRVPEWCRRYTLTVNGAACASQAEGFAIAERNWQTGDELCLTLEMQPERLYTDPRVCADEGKVCFRRGPMVYCAESQDADGSLTGLVIPPDSPIRQEEAELCGQRYIRLSINALRRMPQQRLYSPVPPSAEPVVLHLLPYAYWANRGEQEMRVFFVEGGQGK